MFLVNTNELTRYKAYDNSGNCYNLEINVGLIKKIFNYHEHETINLDHINKEKEIIYKQIDELKIPYRAIKISDSDGGDRQFHVYDTTGPYTDPSYDINLDLGLPKLRDHWLQNRHHEFKLDCRFKDK